MCLENLTNASMSEKFREAEKKQWQMGWFILSQVLGNLYVDEELSILEHYYMQRVIQVLRRRTCVRHGVYPQGA